MRLGTYVRELPGLLREILAAPALVRAALLILPYAGVLVGLDVASRYGDVTGQGLPAQFFLSQDWSFGECLEYALMAAVATMLFLMWRRDRSPILLVNALLFAYLATDNALEWHEQFGFWIAPALGAVLPSDLPMDVNYFGEPLLFGFVGVVWLTGLALSLRQSRPRPILQSLLIVGCIAGAAFFGIVVDAMTDWGPHTLLRTDTEAFIEDGGEFGMIILAFLLTTAMFDTDHARARAVSDNDLAELPLAA
ncbi:hypothetical protein [Tsuneonella sp. HG222]